jgi:hypothetical protein
MLYRAQKWFRTNPEVKRGAVSGRDIFEAESATAK